MAWDDELPEAQHKQLRIARVQIKTAKVTEEQVLEMRELYWHKGWSNRQIREKYKLSRSTVHKIITGQTWQHVWMPEEY